MCITIASYVVANLVPPGRPSGSTCGGACRTRPPRSSDRRTAAAWRRKSYR